MLMWTVSHSRRFMLELLFASMAIYVVNVTDVTEQKWQMQQIQHSYLKASVLGLGALCHVVQFKCNADCIRQLFCSRLQCYVV